MGLELKTIGWRSRTLWHGVGYFLSAGWMLYVLIVTGGEVIHPLFDYIFIVPLGLWAVGLTVAWAIRKLGPSPPPPDRPEP